MAGGAAAGLLVTLLAGRGPGAMLGIFLLAGTAAAVLAVRPRAAYLLIPVPPLAYVVAASLAGLVHDRAADTSHAALAISAARWIASGFPAMTAATLLAIVVTAAGWLAARRGSWPESLESASREVREQGTSRAWHVIPCSPRRGGEGLQPRRIAKL